MLNICMIVPGMPGSEEEWFLPYLTDYVRCLSARARVKVYALKHPPEERSYEVYGVPVKAFGGGRLRLQTQLLNAVLADHNLEPYTHVHAVWANTAGFFGAMVARNLKLPLIVTMAGEELVKMPRIQYGAMRKWRTRPALRYALSTADAVVAPSSGTRNRLMHVWNVPSAKLHAIWFGADIERFAPADSPPEGPLHILAAGGLVAVKRHALLIDALPLVRQRAPGARLTIAGDGPLRAQLKSLAAGLGVADAVRFAGWVHHRDMPALYRTAHIAAVTSYHEEIPVALTEALACGLGAVSVNVGIAADLDETGLFPLRIAEPEPASVAESILALWEQRGDPPAPLPDSARELLSTAATVEKMADLFARLQG